MYFQGLLLAFLAASASADDVSRIRVQDNWSSAVGCTKSFSTSTFCDAPRNYEFYSKTGEQFKIFCPEFRSDPCDKASMTFMEGCKKIVKCGAVGPFQIVSNSTKMTAALIGTGANVQCSAKLIHEPRDYEIIVSNPNDGPQSIEGPDRWYIEPTDQAWRILTSKGNKISVTCKVELAKKLNNVCVSDILSINNGEGWKEYCGYDKVSTTSTGPELKIRLESFAPAGANSAKCTFTSVKA